MCLVSRLTWCFLLICFWRLALGCLRFIGDAGGWLLGLVSLRFAL